MTGPAKAFSRKIEPGDLIPPTDPRFGIVWINPDRMSGTPCFAGTRVPIQHLWDYLETDETIESFLGDFPGVTREQVLALIELAKSHVLDGIAAA